MPIIDIDTHWAEARDFWTSRAPAKFRDVAPRVERDENGLDHWVVEEDMIMCPVGYCVIKEDGDKVFGKLAVDTFDEMHPGASQPKERLKIMDEHRINVQILYPNALGFAGSLVMQMKDAELRNFCVTAYNDAMAEVQAEGEGRLFPQAVVPFWDMDLAVKELERCHDELGMTGLVVTDSPETYGLPNLLQSYWEPLWSVAQERGLPVNFHIGGGFSPGEPWQGFFAPGGIACSSTLAHLGNIRTVANLIFSGLLDRFPSLKFVSVESGIGWLPFLLEFAEWQFDENKVTHLELRPMEYFRRQIFASYWFESDAETVIRKLGADNIMFETDIPHPTCLYPAIQDKVTETLGGLGEEAQRKVLYENASRVYGIELPASA